RAPRILQSVRDLRRIRYGLSGQLSALRVLRSCHVVLAAPPRVGSTADSRSRLAHGVGPRLPANHVRPRTVRADGFHRTLGAQPRVPGSLPTRSRARDRVAVVDLQLAPDGVVREGQLSQGRTRLHRFHHDGEPDAGAGAPYSGRGIRSA